MTNTNPEARVVEALTGIEIPWDDRGNVFRIREREARVIIAALAAEGKVIEDDWRPIDSAPKDGTHVLVIDANAPTPEAMKAHWAQHDAWGSNPTWLCGKTWPPFWKMTPRVARAYGEIVGEVMSPTHWMPLPPPPLDGGGAGT